VYSRWLFLEEKAALRSCLWVQLLWFRYSHKLLRAYPQIATPVGEWSVFGNCVEINSIGFPSIPLKNAEWMGREVYSKKQKRPDQNQSKHRPGGAHPQASPAGRAYRE
jgi:hypothetical protein